MKKNDLKKRIYNLNNNMSNNTITTVNIDDSAKEEESDNDDIVDIENDDDKLLKITGFTNTVQEDGRVPKKGEKYYHYWQNFKNITNHTSVLLYNKYELYKNTILKKDYEKTYIYDKKYNEYIKSRRICMKCTVDKDLNDDFSKNSRLDSGREYTCKECKNQQLHEYNSTSDGCIKRSVNNCKSSAKSRGKRGRIGASECTLTEYQVKEMFKKQGGLCHYYKSPLVYTMCGDKMSIERLDNTKGYTEENCVLVCQLANGFAQTTLKNIKDAMDFVELTEEEKINLEKYDLTKPPLKKRVKIEEKINDEGIKTYNCTFCGERKTIDQFGKAYNNGCKNCINNVEYIKPYNTIERMCKNAKNNSKARTAKGRPNMVFEITIDDFIDIFKKQYGLCAISHMLLEFHNGNISIDRIDTSIGYTKVNTQLVRSQYNTGDRSAVLIKRKGESGIFDCGWTREKFLIKIEGLKDYYNKKNIVADVVEEKIIPVVVKLIENRKRKRWTENENNRLERLNKEKVSRKKIAEMMGRTEDSIKAQILKLNL